MVQVTEIAWETVGKFCTSGALLKLTLGVVIALQSLVTFIFSVMLVVAVPVCGVRHSPTAPTEQTL
ncbi:hypothetical protein D3C85_1743790 [compost metagenome]